MTEISLLKYQNNLDNLLANNKFNEVIAHCRHILAEYPKNLTAYRQMGQALFIASRWEESAELFRRLLGSLPNDFVAHFHLSEIYQQLEQYDDAIWHMERAYDQQPNNNDIINTLRSLYKQHRGVDIQRLQLTAGAVAQQHIRNNLYQQAIAVLTKALERYPNRVDLQLLRARALWYAERHLDAAERAVEILAVLPFAMTANRILTELWLMEQRPSDAQRYLSKIEDLDPYLAYRLATGEKAPDSIVILEELDYESISRHQLATSNPDWLSAMGDVEVTDDILSDDPDDLALLADEPEPKKVTDDLENLLPDEWQERVDQLDTESVAGDDLDDLFDADLDDFDIDDDLFDDFDDELSEESASEEDDGEKLTTDELNLPEGMSTDDLPADLLNRIEKMKGLSNEDTVAANLPNDDPSRASTGLTGMLSQLEADNDMSWLTEIQQGDFDATGQTDDLEDDEQDDQDEIDAEDDVQQDDDSDWLRELAALESSPDAQRVSTGLTGALDEDSEGDIGDMLDELDEDEEPDFFANLDEEEADESAEPINPDDPTAWMQASGIEMVEDDGEQEISDPYGVEEDGVSLESAEVSPMAWLDDDAITEDSPAEPDVDPAEPNPTAWMENEDVDVASDTEDLFADSDSEDGDDTPQFLDESEIIETDDADILDLDDEDAEEEDWLGDSAMLDEMLSMEEAQVDFDFDVEGDSDTDDLDVTDETATSHDWQDDMNDELNNDWQDEQPDDDNDPMAWLSDEDDDVLDDDNQDEDEIVSQTGGTAELTESTLIEDEVDLEDMFAQMSEDELEDGDEELEWLETQELSDSATPVDLVDETISEDDFDDDDEALDWLEAQELADSASPVNLVDEAVEDEDGDDPLAWLSDSSAEVAEDGQSTGITDMLNALEQEEDDFSFKVESGDVEENFFDTEEDEDSAEPATEQAGEASDGHWLDRIELEADDEDAADGDSDWLADEEPATAQAVEAEADWLADIEVDDELDQAESADEVDWLADDAGGFELEASAEPDELFDFGDDDDEEEEQFDFEPETSSVADDSEPDWLSVIDSVGDEFDIEDEEAEEVAEPDWLSSDDGFGDNDDVDEAVAEQPDWLSEVPRDDEDQEEAVENTDEWLSELGDFEAEQDEGVEDDSAEPAEQSDWLDDAGIVAGAGVAGAVAADALFGDDDEEEEVVAEEGEADWLSEMGDFEDDGDEEEEAVAEEGEADWLSEMGDFEDDGDEEEEAVAQSDTGELEWMSEDEDEHIAETAVGATVDVDNLEEVASAPDEALDWMTDADAEDELIFGDDEEEVVEPVAEKSDEGWLSDLGDFEEEEAVAEEGEADWLSELGDFEDDSEIEATSDMELELDDSDALMDTPPVDEADWLDEMAEGDGVQDAFAEDVADSLEWEEDTLMSEAEAVEEPDWLEGMEAGDGVQDAFADSTPEAELEDDMVSDSSWLDAVADDEFEADELPELEEEFSAATQPSSGLADEDYLADFDEEVEHTPADDAPDWLNAMVPGLDIDYEAEEDEPVDQGFIEEAQATPQSDKGFDWLNDIVEEETGPIKPIAPRPQPVSAPRFNFSRPPVWMRSNEDDAMVASATSLAEDVADDLSFDDDDMDFDDFDEDFDTQMNASHSDDDMGFDDFDDNFDTQVNASQSDDDDDDFSFDDFDDNFDTQVNASQSSDDDDDLPEWLDFDDED